MIFSLTKLVALVFGLVVIAKTLTDYRQKKENWRMFLFWLLIWLGIIFLAFNPIIIDKMITRFGHGTYTIGQVVGMGFVFILFVVYRVYVKAHRLEREINHLVRKIALKDLKGSRKK